MTNEHFVNNGSPVEQLRLFFVIAFDFIVTFMIAIPMMFIEIYKLFSFKRKDVRGKLALVTGGGNGLGRSMSLKLADLGCNVAVVDVDLKAAEKTVQEIIAKGVKARAYKADVTKKEQILKLRDDTRNDLGPVDILVNNAGLMSNRNVDESAEYIELMIKVNLLGPILMTKYFLEQMKENQSGHIVCIASMCGMHATPFGAPYTSTKFGVNGFMASLTEHLRLEKWRPKIKTTCVFPYYIKTRQDVTESLNSYIRFPPLEVDETANEAIEGILREDYVVTIPGHQKPMTKFYQIFPLSVQELIRDRVLREFEFFNPNCKLNFGQEKTGE